MVRRYLKPKDRTVTVRMKRYRSRLEVHERRPCITIGPTITNVLVDAGLLKESELEDRECLGRACETALQMWVDDRAKWLERHFTRNTTGRKD
jgi:hypothetical protein